MAIINMTYAVKETILTNVRQVFEEDRKKIDLAQLNTTPAIGDELSSWIMPLADQKKVLDLLPESARHTHNVIYLNVVPLGSDGAYSQHVQVALNTPRLHLQGYWGVENIPGMDQAGWDGNTLQVVPSADYEEKAPNSPTKDLILAMLKHAKQHDKITEAANEAERTMSAFLNQHRTVQSALKAFGPALMVYLGDWLREELKRVPPKRVRRPAAPKEPVEPINIGKLVTKATKIKLNI